MLIFDAVLSLSLGVLECVNQLVVLLQKSDYWFYSEILGKEENLWLKNGSLGKCGFEEFAA